MKNKKLFLGAGMLVILIAVFAIAYGAFREKPVEGSKAITIEVVNKAQETTAYELKTDAEFLRQAMDEAGITYDIQDGMINNVNGEVADYAKDGAYWSIEINGEYGMNGVETQPVVDGDTYTIIYTVYVAG